VVLEVDPEVADWTEKVKYNYTGGERFRDIKTLQW
jgi:hypothetical protein